MTLKEVVDLWSARPVDVQEIVHQWTQPVDVAAIVRRWNHE